MKKLYSFDIFDTCLVRLCGDPDNVVEILSNRIVKLLKDDSLFDFQGSEEHFRHLFVAIRKKYSGNLDECYKKISSVLPIQVAPEEMAKMEMNLEREMLVPVKHTLDLVNRARTKGKVVYISDMYLPSDFLKKILEEYGFYKQGDEIYVSDELNAWKRDGTLYRYVKIKENVNYWHWHHFGDNRKSDVKVPRRLGIHSHYIHYDYLSFEKRWLRFPNFLNKSEKILAGLSRAIRLSAQGDKDQVAFVSDFSAPVQCIWMSHVLQDAANNNIQKLFFCARDVHSEYRIALRLAAKVPDFHGIIPNYLFTSQIALENDTGLASQYYEQLGMYPTDNIGLVDSRTRGWSLMRLQNSILRAGDRPVKTYYWLLDSQSEESMNILQKYPIDSTYLTSEIFRNKRSKEAALGELGALFENGFSLNYHCKTIGYFRRQNGGISPKFSTTDDEISWEMPNLRKLKHDNDEILDAYTDGFISCGLVSYIESLYGYFLPNLLIDFSSAPPKYLLRYLNKIWLLGVKHPFVCNVFNYKNRKGRWRFGSVIYTLPFPMDRLYIAIRYSKVGGKFRKLLKFKI